ncbi:hypothetical protein PCANB_000367 [Pneumocystis canis]|nr:hypothetical protein PCK1_000264 [Pneumocystis canis]KAG5438020.1 hypothetical protein PCANB_000367 [Pneumocystis canis]
MKMDTITTISCSDEHLENTEFLDSKNVSLIEDQAESDYPGMSHTCFGELVEEIKPITDEEKEKKIKNLKEMLYERRMTQKIKEEQEACKNELIRRKRNQEFIKLVEDQKQKLQLREISLRKEEKKYDLLEKKRIKQQIEADKRQRKENEERARIMKNKVSEDNQPVILISKTTSYDTTRLQIRVESGTRCSPIIRVFSSKDTLRLVAESIFSESGVTPDTAIFISTFPKREYFGNDLDKTLEELQLVPSSVLILRS